MRMEQALFAVSVYALIFKEKDYVLLGHRRDFDLWSLPGGGLRHGETATEGVIREVKEKTGLIVEAEQLVGVYSKPYKDELVLAFRCRPVEGEPRPSEEIAEWRYFSVDELPRNILPKHRERILDAARYQTPAILRVQNGPADLEVLGLV